MYQIIVHNNRIVQHGFNQNFYKSNSGVAAKVNYLYNKALKAIIPRRLPLYGCFVNYASQFELLFKFYRENISQKNPDEMANLPKGRDAKPGAYRPQQRTMVARPPNRVIFIFSQEGAYAKNH